MLLLKFFSCNFSVHTCFCLYIFISVGLIKAYSVCVALNKSFRLFLSENISVGTLVYKMDRSATVNHDNL